MAQEVTQQIQYFDKPTPHLIIDNFLPTVMAQAFLDEAVSLNKQGKYKPAEIGNSPKVDGCKECQKILEMNQLIKRKNDVVYLDVPEYDNNLFKRGLTEATNDPSFKTFMGELPSMFPIINNCDHTECILSRHGMCDFYGWHKDNDLAHLKKNRIITMIVIMRCPTY